MRKNLPQSVAKYAESLLFNEHTVPDKLTSNHDLKPGVWGRICVMSGTLEYNVCGDPPRAYPIKAGQHVIIEPGLVHFVTPTGKVEFKVEFYR